MRALYIGRFQVFHLGHLDVLQFIASAPDVDELLLGLGSTQYDHTRRSPHAPWEANPFTTAERRALIEGALDELGGLEKPASIHELPDFHDWVRWHAHLVSVLPPFGVLYTADRAERDFFAERGTIVRPFPRKRSFHAGAIREALVTGDPAWREMVPPSVARQLDALDAGARLRALRQRDQAEAGTTEAPTPPPPPPARASVR